MQICPFCGQNAGLFHSEHSECRRKHDTGVHNLRHLVTDAILTDKDISVTRQQAEHLARASHIHAAEYSSIVAQGWNVALDNRIAAQQMSPPYLARLMAAADNFQIDRAALQRLGVQEKLLRYDYEQKKHQAEQQKAASIAVSKQQAVAAIRQGNLPRYPYPTPVLPFLETKAEFPVWLFENVSYHEEKIKRKSVRDYGGISYRGYHAGQSVSHSIEWSEMVSGGAGTVALTPKYFYFAGPEKSFRVAYSKIVTVNPYLDGLEVFKDAASPKKQLFSNLEGGFAYEMIQAISLR